VENIPLDKFTVEHIQGHFGQFGEISKVNLLPSYKGQQMHYPSGRATVEFTSKEWAHNAYASPDAIFGNRFVRVKFWRAPTDNPHQMYGQSQEIETQIVAGGSNVDTESSSQKQKKQEQLEKMLELQRQKELLIKKHIEQQKEIMERMAALAQKKGADDKNSESSTSHTMSSSEKELLESLKRMSDSLRGTSANLPPDVAQVTVKENVSAQATQKLWEDKEKLRVSMEKERLDRELDILSKKELSSPAPQLDSEQVDQVNLSREEELKKKLALLKAEAASIGVPDQALRPAHFPSYRPYPQRFNNMTYRPGQAARPRPFFPTTPNYSQFSLDNRPRRIGMKILHNAVIGLEVLKTHFEVLIFEV
jgi:RNA-binding protein 26